MDPLSLSHSRPFLRARRFRVGFMVNWPKPSDGQPAVLWIAEKRGLFQNNRPKCEESNVSKFKPLYCFSNRSERHLCDEVHLIWPMGLRIQWTL